MGRAIRVLAVVVSVVLVAAACASGDDGGAESAESAGRVSVEVTPEAGGELVDGDLRVVVPPGAVSEPTELVASPVDDPVVSVGGVVPAGSAVDLSLEDGELVGGVTIELPVDVDQLDGSDEFDPVAWYSESEDAPWEFAGGTFDAERGVVVVETDHLSSWMPWSWDWGWVGESVEGLVAGVWGEDPFGVDDPVCEGPPVDAEIEVTSTSSDAIKWCVEGIDGGALVRMVNNRHYTVVVDPPATATVIEQPQLGSTLEDIGPHAENLFAQLGDTGGFAMGRGQTAVIELPVEPGTVATISAVPSGASYLTDVLEVGVSMLSLMFPKEQAVKLIGAANDSGCVVEQFQGALGSGDPTGDPKGFVTSAIDLLFGCVGEAADQVFSSLALGAAKALLGVLSGLVVGVIAGFEFFTSLFQGDYNYELKIADHGTSSAAGGALLVDTEWQLSATPFWAHELEAPADCSPVVATPPIGSPVTIIWTESWQLDRDFVETYPDAENYRTSQLKVEGAETATMHSAWLPPVTNHLGGSPGRWIVMAELVHVDGRQTRLSVDPPLGADADEPGMTAVRDDMELDLSALGDALAVETAVMPDWWDRDPTQVCGAFEATVDWSAYGD